MHIVKRTMTFVVACALLSLLISVDATSSVAGTSVENSSQELTFLTIAQGDALGVSPGMAGPNGEVPWFKVLKDPPPSASGCNQAVCIDIIGVGLYVSGWTTNAYFTSSQETYTAYWANGTIIATSTPGYVPAGDYGYSGWSTDQYFANNTMVCNTWVAAPGKPCETIHS